MNSIIEAQEEYFAQDPSPYIPMPAPFMPPINPRQVMSGSIADISLESFTRYYKAKRRYDKLVEDHNSRQRNTASTIQAIQWDNKINSDLAPMPHPKPHEILPIGTRVTWTRPSHRVHPKVVTATIVDHNIQNGAFLNYYVTIDGHIQRFAAYHHDLHVIK